MLFASRYGTTAMKRCRALTCFFFQARAEEVASRVLMDPAPGVDPGWNLLVVPGLAAATAAAAIAAAAAASDPGRSQEVSRVAELAK